MEKKFASNIKISHALIAMILSILFIFTALANPLVAHAYEPAKTDGSGRAPTEIPYVINLNMYESNEEDESTNDTAGYLSYAASGDRCGVLFYVIDDRAKIQAIGILLDEKGTGKYGMYHNYANDSELDDAIGAQKADGVLHPLHADDGVKYVSNVSPVEYSGGWTSIGSDVMAYLTSDSGDTLTINDVPMPCPRWAKYVLGVEGGAEALKRLAEPNTKWQVIVEPVSVNYLYTEDAFPTDRGKIDNVVAGPKHQSFEAGSPRPVGSWQGTRYLPTVYIGTARNLLKQSNNIAPGGSQYTYKFYNKQFPYSMCLSNDIEVPIYAGGMQTGTRPIHGVSLSGSIPRLTSSISQDDGIGLASIEISAISLPPIHTYNGTNSPGETEIPDPSKGTAGECVIKKLYYTETYTADGELESTTVDAHFTRTGTKNYVSIDEEEGDYVLEKWKRSKNPVGFTSPDTFDDISGTLGTSAGIERLQQTDNKKDKYLYILYKKTVVNPPEVVEPWEFQLQESQISKRVAFRHSTKTAALITNSFSWTSPAHTTTSCQVHGGYGHHLNCNTEWDVAPVAGVPHTHTNACYDTPCSSFAFTDATVKLGIKLDNSSVNQAVVSKYHKAIYNDTAIYDEDGPVPAIQSNTHYGEFTRTNSGADTQSKSNFNFVTVLFRGNDKLTLADWKNNATTKSYLTNIAYDSNYNFKSANTPQGTRKAGEEYTETTGTKFINSSLDNQTTYKATVGAHGTCGSTKSYTFTKADGTSSDYTIQDIKVNIKVFWANGIGPSSSAPLPSTQVAGSASFYPYIRMRYDNNTQNDKTVYVLGQRKRTVTVYDYASVSISGGDSKLAINSSQYYSSLF